MFVAKDLKLAVVTNFTGEKRLNEVRVVTFHKLASFVYGYVYSFLNVCACVDSAIRACINRLMCR